MLHVVHGEVCVLDLFRAYFSQPFVVPIEQGGNILSVVRPIAVIQTKLEQKVFFKTEKLVIRGCCHGGRW